VGIPGWEDKWEVSPEQPQARLQVLDITAR
jgi:hypothetical protein